MIEEGRVLFDKVAIGTAELVFCERFDESSPIWNLDRHSHDYMEMLYFLDGQALIKGQTKEEILSPYEMIVYPEHIMHQEYLPLDKHQEVVCIGIKFRKPTGITAIFRPSDVCGNLRWVMTEIHRQNNILKRSSPEIVHHLTSLLLFYLNQMSMMQDLFRSQTRVDTAISYILDNYSERITIKELSMVTNASPSFLNRIFQNEVGYSPIEYLNRIRLSIAKKLLINPGATVEKVCSSVGIDDPKYFSRLFKKKEGMSPKEFMNNSRLRKKYEDVLN